MAREALRERRRALVGEHALDLALELIGLVQLAGDGGVDELVVGQAAPQEERQARRELEVADAVEAARRRVGRVLLDAEQELRRDEYVSERRLQAGLEVAALPALGAVEAEQPRALVGGDRAAIRAARERTSYLLGACRGLRLDLVLSAGGCHRITSEYALAACRAPGPKTSAALR